MNSEKQNAFLELLYGPEYIDEYFLWVVWNETIQSAALLLIFAALIIPRLAAPILGGLRCARSLLRRGKENADKTDKEKGTAKETETRQPPNIHAQLEDLRLLLKHGHLHSYLDRAETIFAKKVFEKDANQLTEKETVQLAKISNRYTTVLERLR